MAIQIVAIKQNTRLKNGASMTLIQLYTPANKGRIMSEWQDEPLTYTASMPELMTAQDIMYLAEDIVADNNIQAIYKPAELSLEVV
jgi:hypothetical protein